MRTLSSGFLAASGRYYARLALADGTSISGDAIKSLSISSSAVGATDRLTLGGSPAATLTAVLTQPEQSLLDQQVQVYLGRMVSGALEEVSLGKFTVTDASSVDDTVTLTGYDAMYTALETAYYPTISGATTAKAVLADVAAAAGLSLRYSESVADVGVSGVSTGYTLREMAGYMAALLGGNAWIDSSEALRIGWITASGLALDGDQIYSGGASLAPADWTLGRLTCTVTTTKTETDQDENGNTIVSSTDETITLTAGTGATGVSLSNPWMTQTVLNGIWERVGGLTYRGGTVSALGDLRLEPGDLITVTDSAGTSSCLPIMSQNLEYDGGLRMTLSAWAQSASDGGGEGVTGPLTQAMERYTAQLAIFKQLEAQNLTAIRGRIAHLTATTASITQLEAVQADIEALEARTADIEEAYITTATVEQLLADYATVEQLEAAQADIEELAASTANIETLLAGQAGVGSLQAIHLTGDNVVIDDAIIQDAMIASVAADKLTAGRISTDLVEVSSDNGRLLLDGETIQISDADRVRVQIGKDASGDYNLYLWGADGSLMWDAGGLYGPGIHDGIIKDAAVADDAAISGSKLDITSVASKLTEDGTLIVDASRVTIDETTLDVAYQTITTATDGLGSRTTALETNLEVVQGQISAKIWQTDITEITDPLGGKVTALEDQYSQIDQTLGRIDLSVGNLQTKVDAQGTEIESVTGRLSLYVEKTDNGQIVSMLNASADMISLTGNRVTIDSDLFKLAANGTITAFAGTIGGWTIEDKTLYSTSRSGNFRMELKPAIDDEAPYLLMRGANSTSAWITPYMGENSQELERLELICGASRIALSYRDNGGGVNVEGGLSLDGTPMADFVAAQGTSGSWNYIKFGNGLALCSRRSEFSGAYIGAKQGELYVSGGAVVTSSAYPFAFTSPPVEEITLRTGAKFVFPMGTSHNTNTASGAYTLASPVAYNTASTAVAGVGNLLVIGRWK